jgi:hypothetical protein
MKKYFANLKTLGAEELSAIVIRSRVLAFVGNRQMVLSKKKMMDSMVNF